MSLIADRAKTTKRLLVLAAYAMTFVVYTWPLALNFNTRLLGIPYDNYGNAWELWWWKYALAHAHNPYFTHLIFFPRGKTARARQSGACNLPPC